MKLLKQNRAREQAGVTSGVVRGRDGSRSLTRLRSATPRHAVAAQSGFTMMEIAISLAIIGIALVAIIGVLPIGMNVQQDNRQQTIVGQDASVFMEAIRNGQLGLDDLTNYVYAITNYWTQWSAQGVPGNTYVNGYTYSSASMGNSGYPGYPNAWPLTNGANIIGLLSTPEYIATAGDGIGDSPGQPIPSLFFGGISNHVVAYVYSISGSAVEKPPQNNPLMQQDSFGYRIYCVNTPIPLDTNDLFQDFGPWISGTSYQSGNRVFYNWNYWASLVNNNSGNVPTNNSPYWSLAPDYTLTMEPNTHDLRLTFEWPQLPNGSLGSGRQTFRTIVSGQLTHLPSFNPESTGGPSPPIQWDPYLYVYQPESYTNAP